MKKIVFFTIILCSLLSCNKSDKNTVSPNADSFTFGTAYGYCVGNCTKIFKVQAGKIYPDTTDRYSGPGSVGFSNIALPDTKYLLAKDLQAEVPQYLLNRPDAVIGCPDCADQGGIYIELKQKGVTTYWHIDTAVSRQPVEIRPFISKLLAVLAQL